MRRQRLPRRTRRLAAVALFGTGILALVFDAFPDAPLAVSFSLGRKFWRAQELGRVINAPTLRDDPEFAMAVAAADKRWPLDVDAVLTLPPGLSAETAEARRRAAALILSPRRVLLERAVPSEGRFRLRPLPRSRP
ncbi:MAG: hypothetical protein ACHQPI_13555 [Thermoanaerobaculia bacterium]